MDNKLASELSSILWNDLNSSNSELKDIPTLAHYTSISTLEKIVENNQLWLSNPLLMNDYEEIRFGMLEGARVFRESERLRLACKTQENHEKLMAFFHELFSEFDQKYLIDTYVLCLTEHQVNDLDGSLAMWRGYGDSGGGVAIVFDIREIPKDQDAILLLDKVHYGSNESRIEWINEKIEKLAIALEENIPTEEDLYYTASLWIERLKIFSLFTKHHGFREENEWRLVYLIERDPKGIYSNMIHYSVTAKGVEPKLKLDLFALAEHFQESFSLDRIVNSIILGPTASSAINRSAVCRMLKLLGKNELSNKVYSSSIPFRT